MVASSSPCFSIRLAILSRYLLAILGLAMAPLLKRCVSRSGRAIDVFGVPTPGTGEHAVSGRVQRFECFAARAFGPPAVDVVLDGSARQPGTNLIDKLRADARCWGRGGHACIRCAPVVWMPLLYIHIGPAPPIANPAMMPLRIVPADDARPAHRHLNAAA